MKALMVDVKLDIAKFKKFDDRFQAETYCVELADGTRSRRTQRKCGGVLDRQ